jgi:hypothetical protein
MGYRFYYSSDRLWLPVLIMIPISGVCLICYSLLEVLSSRAHYHLIPPV